MNEHLGMAEEAGRRRLAHPQHLYVAPLYRGARGHPAGVLEAVTLDMLHTTADTLSEKTRMPPDATPPAPTAKNVMEKFCAVYQELSGRSYTFSDLRSVRRSAPIAKPRHVCILLVKEICGLSQTQIGDRFHRDHTTVLFGLRRAQIHLTDPTLQAAHDAVTAFFAEAK